MKSSTFITIIQAVGLASVVAGLSGPVLAQTGRDISRDFRAPARVTPRVWTPPMPAQVCVFTGEKYTGNRLCLDPTVRVHLGRPFNRTIRSFTVPYGYEAEFFNDLVLDAPDTPVELLCTYRQTSISRYTMGVDVLKMGLPTDDGSQPYGFDRCVGPRPYSALTTQLAFRKIPTITDAQRAAVWAGWERNDNENCGVRIYPSLSVPDTARITRKSLSDRVNCYGRRVDMSDLSKLWHGGTANWRLSLSADFGQLQISSRSGRIELFELPNFRGRHMRLGCGNYRLSPTMATSIKSAFVMPVEDDSVVPATNCSNTVQVISSWNDVSGNDVSGNDVSGNDVSGNGVSGDLSQPFAPTNPKP
jgi:hypothetical protein